MMECVVVHMKWNVQSQSLLSNQVALAAVQGGGSSDGGIGVTTSNPVRLSNPINLAGGNYNGQLNGAFGK